MRACLLLCAALALAPSRPRAAAASPRASPRASSRASPQHAPEPARLEHIKTQILAKLGLTSRPTPLGAPPRDVVRQILARAADPRPERRPDTEQSMREIIAIAHRGNLKKAVLQLSTFTEGQRRYNKCDLACKRSSSGPAFLNGHTYNYAVEGHVKVYLTGGDKQETNVKIFGQVAVTAYGNCELSLKVNSLAISGPDGKKYTPPKGIEKVVRFNLEDGRAGPEICTEEGDTKASLNVKRAIISLLQTEQKPSTQTDVFGTCPTEVSASQEGGAVLVHRSRDLSRCAHREQTRNELITAVYNPTAEIKNTQLLQSILNVESKVNNGVPEKVAATEQYLYRPFSVGENGARAEVTTKLSLSGTAKGSGAGGQCTVPRTIIFENPNDDLASHSSSQHLMSAIKETCKTLNNEASSKSAGNFAQLVRIFRTVNKGDLMKVFGQVKGNSLEKRVYLDALLRAGTGYSIEASIQILKNKELNEIEEKVVFLSLGNARHVTSEAIKAAASLLDLPNLPKGVYLGVGALAGTYCRDHNCHSEKADGIVALSKKLAGKLQNCRPKTKLEEDNVVAVLKGIRNIGHLEDSLIDKLVHCAAENNVKARVRVAALEAFQADSCSSKVKKTALDIMKNHQLDSEIRIKAYLAVIDCPCGKSANEIKTLLESERVHQVARFISTSLRAIRASANPDKHHARQHYGLIGIPNKYNVDDRKYSFYREMSYNVDALGVGGNVEQSVIYSQDSFIPRSVSLNLTAEVFGHNVNILEVGGRQGNLDRVVEHFLGPRGLFRTKEPQELFDEFQTKMSESAQKAQKSVRGRRSIKSEVDNFDRQVKAESAPYNNELDLDVYVKLFGTDAVFLSFGDGKGFDANGFLDESFKMINEGMDKMKHFQQELRGHLLFLDAELAYPTSTGLPLKLDAIGAATGRVEVSSSVDIRQCLRNPESAKVDIKLIPSTDVEISLIMLVDAGSVATGLKVITNLHSSTGGHVSAKVIENGNGIDLQWGLPLDKQEILTASSDMVFFTAENGQLEKRTPVTPASQKNEYSGCFDQLSQVLGLTLCGKLTLPFSFNGPKSQNSVSQYLSRYPLVGSTTVNLVLEKNDLRGYHIKGVLRNDPKGRYGIELLFDAEGSKNRRTQITANLINNPEEKTVQLNFESPIKTLYGQFSVYTKSSEYALVMTAKMDEASYYGRIGLNIEGNDRRRVYKPVLEYQVPQSPKKNIHVDGQIIAEKTGGGVKYTVSDVKFNLPESKEPVTLMGQFSREPKKMEMDLKMMKGQHNAMLSASLANYDFKADFRNTLNPYVNFKVNGHFENVEGLNHNEFDLYYSEDCSNSNYRVTFSQYFKRQNVIQNSQTKGTSIIIKNKLDYYLAPLNLKFNLELDPKKIDLEVGGLYIDKEANLKVDGRTHIKKEGDYKVKWAINFDKQAVEGLVKRDIESPDKSKLENYIDFKNLGRYELNGVVLHRVKANDVNVGALGNLKISGAGKNEDIKFDIGYIETAKLSSSHATVSSSKGELLNFLLKINTGANTNGQLKLNLKDAVAANGQFHVSDNDGKGNGNIMVHFKMADRVIKGDVKFVVKDPTYSADVDLFLNFGKNDNDKIHFSTNNKKSDKLLDSKNKLEYDSKTTELNLYGAYQNLGNNHASVEVVLPDKRCLSFKIDREFTEKDDMVNGQATAVFSDAANRGGPASTIKYIAKVTNTNWDKGAIDLEGQLELNIHGGKNLLNTFSLKNVPKEPKSDISFRNEISGTMLSKKGIIDVTLTYMEGDTIDDNYRVKMSYGDDLAMEMFGNYQVNLPNKGVRKYVEDSTVTLRLPWETAHDIKWVSKFAYNHPENQAAEVTIIQSVQVNADLFKVESSGKYDLKNGNTKLKIILPHVDPVNIDAQYKIDDTKDKTSGAVNVNAHYGKGKTTSLSIQGASNQKELDLKFLVNSPQNDKFKKMEINMNAKNPSPDTFNTVIVIDADGRVYKSEGLIVYSSSQPVFDLKYSSPASPKTTRLYFKGISSRPTQGRMEVRIENIKNFDLDSTFEVNFDKDLIVKFHANAPTLDLKNYNVDISSKDAGSGKRLEFQAMNDNKNVLSGSTSFISKQEGPKTIIEGSGTLKVKDEQKPANFKYIRTILTEGNEQGVETFINVAYGERNHVAEFRITNLEYKTSYVYCEEKKQCAHAEVNAKLTTTKPGCIQHQFNAGFDLRKLGFNTEFGLQVANEFSDKTFPQYDMNLHVNRENKKYHFHVYSQPEHGKFPAGIVLTFPQRVIALESLVRYPTDKNLPFPVSGEISLYPDKNKPQTKSAARFNFDINGNDRQGEASALIGFSHPRIGKEALIKFRGSLSRPNDNTIKIETNGVISHSCLGHDREAKFFLEVNPVHIKLLLDTPIVKVIDLEGSATAKDNLQQADLVFSLLEGKPVTVYAVAKDFQYYEFTTGYKDESERKLSVVANLNPEKRVDVSVDIVLSKNKKNIVHGALFIEDNLIKSDYGASKDNFNYFVLAFKKDLSVLQERIKNIGEKANEDVKNTLKRIEPTYKQLEQAYRDDFEKLAQDISNDKDLKEISEALHVFTKVIAKLIDDIVTAFKPMADKLAETVSVLSKNIVEMYEKQIAPGLKQLYSNVADVVLTYLDGILNAAAHFTAIIMDFFEKHKPELQELTNIFTEIFKDITRIVVVQLKEWRWKSAAFISEVFEQIKEMPFVAYLKEKWQDLAVPEQFLAIMNEAYNAAREVMPTEEAKTFLDVLRNYAQKKLRQEKFDEQTDLRVVYEKLVAAVTSLVQYVRQTAGQYGISYPIINFANFQGFSPISLPSFKGSASWSLITQALQGDFVNPWALIKAYRPRSLNPLDEVPAKMRAVIINGMHIFTFDGRHLTFPGTCRYVLAHDHVDRNFTLLSQLQNGHPKAIILEDKSGITIELKENGQVALNGANHGYPVIEKEVFAFREAKGRIGLGSLYGLMVFCTSKLEVCYVEVSGFYHGKLRGLLGDGNNEPYDDFRIPNGKIVTSESDFGNAYKLAGSCEPVKTPAHDHHQMHMALPAACEAVFGGTSPLRPLSLLLDNQPFRQACIHACSEDSPKAEQEACDLGRGYAILAQTGLLPAILPSHCLKCTDADKPRKIGEIYDIKTPTKQADIIVTVETTKLSDKVYKDLIVPLVGQVIDQLKSKRVTDVKVYLIGITSKYPYPIIYDTDLKLKSAKVHFDDESRYNKLKPLRVGDPRTDYYIRYLANIVENFRVAFGLQNIMVSYDTVYDLPLRAGAVKHMISGIGDSCFRQDVLTSSLRSVMYDVFFKNIGLSYSLIKGTHGMKIGGGKDVKQVVGFSKHGVLLLGDKKQKETETLRSTLHLEMSDDCIEFSQDTGGYTFSATTFEACDPGKQKQYLQTAATSIVNRMLHENVVQVCTCSYVDIYRARSVCVVKERKEAARRRK